MIKLCDVCHLAHISSLNAQQLLQEYHASSETQSSRGPTPQNLLSQITPSCAAACDQYLPSVETRMRCFRSQQPHGTDGFRNPLLWLPEDIRKQLFPSIPWPHPPRDESAAPPTVRRLACVQIPAAQTRIQRRGNERVKKMRTARNTGGRRSCRQRQSVMPDRAC